MNLDEVVEKAVEDYCLKNHYSTDVEKLMKNIVKRYRNGSVEDGDLGNFLQQILVLLGGE